MVPSCQGLVPVGIPSMGKGFRVAPSSVAAPCRLGRQHDTRATPSVPMEVARASSAEHTKYRRYFVVQARTAQLGPISPKKRWQASWKCCMSQLWLNSKHLDHPCLNKQSTHPLGGGGGNIILILLEDQKQKMMLYSHKVITSSQTHNIMNVMAIRPLIFKCVNKASLP